MTDDKLEIVREIYARWLDGRSPRELIADDVEYVNPPDAVEGGTRRGRAAFRGLGDVYQDVRIEPERLIDAGGDDVVVIARVRGTGKGSGVEIDWHHGYIWTIRDGVGVRFRWFNKPEEALAAAGISSPAEGEGA